MYLSAFLLSSNLSSNLCIPLYYLTTPFPRSGDLSPPISPVPRGSGCPLSLPSPVPATPCVHSGWLCQHFLFLTILQWKPGICVSSLSVLLPFHATKVSCFSCCASSSVAVPAQLLFLRLDALPEMTGSAPSPYTPNPRALNVQRWHVKNVKHT